MWRVSSRDTTCVKQDQQGNERQRARASENAENALLSVSFTLVHGVLARLFLLAILCLRCSFARNGSL